MKKLLALFYFALIAASNLLPISLSKATAAPVNLIANPSVETVDPANSASPQNWLQGGWGTNTSAFSYATTGQDGSRSVRIDTTAYTNGDAKWYFTPVAVTAGTQYTFSDYYESNITTDVMAQFDDGAGNYSYADLGNQAASASAYAQASINFTAPATAKNVTIFHLINNVGWLQTDYVAPTVAVTAPSTGSTVLGTVQLTASATDSSGVASVQFKIDGANLGSPVTTPPYQTSWNTTGFANGNHTITAVALNTNNVSSTSTAVSVTVNNPVAAGTNLVANPSMETANPSNSSLPQGWQTGSWGTNTTSFSYLTNSAHTGTDSVKVQTTAYTTGDAKWYFTPVFVSPSTQYIFSDYYESNVTTDIMAQFDDGNGNLTFQDLGTQAASTSTWKQVSLNFTTPANTKYVTVFHLLSSVGSLQIDDVSLATPTVPTVNITSPANGNSVSGVVQISATATAPAGVSKVQFLLDGVNLGSAVTAAPYQINWDSSGATAGSHSLTAVVTSKDNKTATSTAVVITVGSQAGNLVPNASLEAVNPANSALPAGWQNGGWGTNTTAFSYPTSGAHTGSRSVKVQTTAYTNGDAKWYFTPVAVTAGSPYSFSDYYISNITTDVMAQFDDGNGNYTFQDLGTQAASTTWKQANITFVVPATAKNVTIFHLINAVGSLQIDDVSLSLSTAPIVTITSPEAGTKAEGIVQLTANANASTGITSVQFKLDGTTNIGSAVTTAPYQTNWDTSTVANGTHFITAVATSKDNKTSTSPVVSVTVTNGSNLIPNPSVETVNPTNSKAPQDWTSSSWGTNTTTFSYLTSGAHTGSHAVKVQMTKYTDGDAKWFFNPVSLRQDTQYKFSDYYQSTVATEVDVAFDLSDGTTVYQIIGLPEASSTWANFTTTFSVPSDAVDMTVFHLIHSVGTLTLDDESLQAYTPTGFNRPLVTLTFDDGYDNMYTQALPLLQKYGFNSTQFIITDVINTTGYMTSAQVKSMYQAGQEIASHTVTHDDMLTETPTQYDSELSKSKTQLQQWTGGTITDMAFPNGLYNKAIVTDTKKYYTGARGVEDGLNSKDNFNAYDIKVQNVYSTTSTDEVADWIQQAQDTNTWLVLVYHSVDPDLNNPVDSGIYNITPGQLDAQLSVLKSSGVTVETMAQAIAEVTPQH